MVKKIKVLQLKFPFQSIRSFFKWQFLPPKIECIQWESATEHVLSYFPSPQRTMEQLGNWISFQDRKHDFQPGASVSFSVLAALTPYQGFPASPSYGSNVPWSKGACWKYLVQCSWPHLGGNLACYIPSSHRKGAYEELPIFMFLSPSPAQILKWAGKKLPKQPSIGT